jgi:hypothetical protein
MTSVDTDVAACGHFQRIASGWLRSGEISRTHHLLSPLEELAGFNYGFVYAIDIGERSGRPVVKIGFSEHPMRRIRELRPLYGTGLRLRKCFVGEPPAERAMHRRFAHLRIEHELFLANDAIDNAFVAARARVRERLKSLHLCYPECPQLVRGLDLRMLRLWLMR